MNQTWLLLLLFPIIVPLLALLKFHKTINFQELAITILGTILVMSCIYFAGMHSTIYDTQILNGRVTSKNQITKNCHNYGHWTRSSDSFCTNERSKEVYDGTTCTGTDESRTCTAQYHTEYKSIYPWERKWYVQSTLEEFMISRVDSQGANTPPRWEIVKINDPVSTTSSFTNYIKAVPDSLFNNGFTTNQHDLFVPAYPEVYDYYKVQRVILAGTPNTTKLQQLNVELGKMLGVINPKNQVNVNIIVTNIKDPKFKYAVEHKWIGGKINDVNIFMGVDGDKIVWLDVMTWARDRNNGIFTSTMRDELGKVGAIDPLALTAAIKKVIVAHYDRPKEEDFEYLKATIQPPMWVLIMAIIVEIGMVIGLLITFHIHDVDFLANRRRY